MDAILLFFKTHVFEVIIIGIVIYILLLSHRRQRNKRLVSYEKITGTTKIYTRDEIWTLGPSGAIAYNHFWTFYARLGRFLPVGKIWAKDSNGVHAYLTYEEITEALGRKW